MNHAARIPRIRKKASTGFTLVEILLALAVFAIGFAMVASVPSGAMVLERRYEQIVEGEIAANNTVSMIGGRRAFWPLYEYGTVSSGCTSGYSAWSPSTLPGGSDPLQPTEGPYIAGMGSSGLRSDAYLAGGTATAMDTTASGMLAPLILFPPLERLSDSKQNPSTRCHDADQQGDCEDFFCNTANPNASGDHGWNSGTQNIRYETDSFLRVFDTNQSGTGEGGNNAGPNAATPLLVNNSPTVYCPSNGLATQAANEDWRWFSDYADRTDFARAKIHCCHNRLAPAITYPVEIRSYPTTEPVAQRRQFISLGYADCNLSASKRQWLMQAVAHTRGASDTWPEGANGLSVSNPMGGWPGTGGDPYNQSMMANGMGLFDSRATAPFSIPNWQNAGSSNSAFTHGHLGAVGWGWPSIVGAVRPLCNNAAQVKGYPSLMRLPAIIYDWDKSQIQVAYPRDYVPGVDGTGPTGLAGDKGSDRRFKVGDHFLTAQGGMLMTVASVQDETRPDYNGTTDGVPTRTFYQIVTVTPPLSTTSLGGAATNDPAVGNNNAGGNAYPYWRLTHVYIAPPPAGQTVSSWSWATTISGQNFISNNPNQ